MAVKESNKMGDFRQSVQQSLENAYCAFAGDENMLELSRITGIRPNMLRNKLNPDQPHRLAVDDLLLITKASGNYCIVNSLLLNLDMVAVHVDRTATDQTLVKRTLENSKNAGELARLTLENGGETRLPRSKRNELLARAHKSVNNLVLLMSDLENKTSGVTPFLSMGIDFIANGAPIPGLG
jgi:hypothetical protein